MGAEARAGVATAAFRPSPRRPWSRVMGLGSIFAKTVRDSRRMAIVVGMVAGLFMLGTGAPYGAAPEFATIELRQQFLRGIEALPAALRGLLGEPIRIETLGGFLSWRVGNTLPVILGLWSVLALASTLAGEAAKGSLDLVAATPQARRSIALQKLAGHVVAVAAAMLIFAVLTWTVGLAFARLLGDEIALDAALGQAVLYGALMLAAGSVAFALAPFVGRTRAAAFGLLALFAGYLIYSYSTLSPLMESLRPLSWYSLTEGHRPLAGVTDWPSVGVLGLLTVGLMAIGVLAFERRDLGDSTALSWLRLPSLPAGIRGPLTRQLADRTAVAIGWGIGIGLYATLIVLSAEAFAQAIGSLPRIAALIEALYPGVDISEPAGLLQLTFYAFGSFLIGLAAASFVAAWSSDESGGRLAVVMGAPISRSRWMVSSGLGVIAAIGVTTLVFAAIVGAAVASQGGEVVEPVIGTGILGLSAAAFAGIGLAAGGLVRASLAAPVTAVLVIATFLLDTLGAALDLPEEILDLSLYQHLGQPMVGTYDAVGLVAATVMAVGGLLVGAWGLQRRDLDR